MNARSIVVTEKSWSVGDIKLKFTTLVFKKLKPLMR